jgi:cytochrome bd ubiquinol oxidase subunit II
VTLELFAAAVMLVALVVYALTGGADFGGGIWDLFARGERAGAQRRAVERALAPVWEANHVWLIFVIVVLFTAFPPAFARLGIDFHIPLTIMLIGVVLRGSAFVFRQYGGRHTQQHWGRVFAVSSLVSPFCLGIVVGALTAGPAWWQPFPLVVGGLTVAAFAMLAAVYLTVELARPGGADEAALRSDFRVRFVAAALVTAILAAMSVVFAPDRFADALLSARSAPIVAGATLAIALAIVASRRKRDRLARAASIAAVTLLVVGWGVAQYPILIAPDLTLHEAAAPKVTLELLVPVVVAGSAILLPSLWWLMRVFKSGQPPRA